MIDTAVEQVFSFSEFSRELKKQRHIERDTATIAGWARYGWTPRLKKKPVIKLETIPIMGVSHTSFEAFDRFLAAQAEAKEAAEMAR